MIIRLFILAFDVPMCGPIIKVIISCYVFYTSMGPTLSGMYSYTTNCWLLRFLGDKFDSIIIRNHLANTQKNPLG